MSKRLEFTRLTKSLGFARAKGKCELCTAHLYPNKFRYDHIIPAEFGGDNSITNLQVICSNCDREKTYKKDLPEIAKSNRIRDKHIGAKTSSRPMPCGRKSKYKKLMNGPVVLR